MSTEQSPTPKLDPASTHSSAEGALHPPGGSYPSRLVGAEIDARFVVDAVAGHGGMGTVYAARDRTSGDQVALKVMHDNLDDAAAGRFEGEARALQELHHPGIVGWVAHGRCPSHGCTYLAMEWLEGEDLASRLLRNGAPPVTDAIALMKRICGPLAYAHSLGLVHRDIKPGNIFLADDGGSGASADPQALASVKLLDFGIARFQDARAKTQTGVAMGTPHYMAPEQARGLSGVDARADVYALGAMLFELLTGRPPFTGEHGLAVLMRALFEEAPTVNELRSQDQRISGGLNTLVKRMLAKDPLERPTDARAVAAALDSLGSIQGTPAAPSAPAGEGRRPVSSLTGEELRIVSVVAAAGPGLAQTNQHDLEPAHRTDRSSQALLEDVRRTVEGYGARLERLADGTLVAMVHGAGLPTEQAVIAARCALAMRGVRPGVPMVVATGRSRAAGHGQPVGEVIERAVATLFETPSNAIAVDDVTAGLLPERFEVHSDGRQMVLVDEREPAAEIRTLLGRPTPCVGRRRELRRLEAVFEDCVEERVPAAVLVNGSPGIGKTRVCVELIRALRQDSADEVGPFHLLYGRAESFGGSAPYALVGDAVRRFVGIHPRDSAEVRRHKLQARVGRYLEEGHRRRVVRFLGEAFGVPFPAAPDDFELVAARKDGRLMADQVKLAFTTWLSSEASQRPLLVFLEDAQWADRPSLNLLDSALGMDELPLFIMAASREVREGLWASRDVTRVQLGPLRDKAAEALVRHVLGEAVTDQEATLLVEQADGNPFFLEELMRVRVVPPKGRGTATSRSTLPDTVLGMVEARLASLSPRARLVLRAASVFGDTFVRDAVSALCGGQLSAGEVGRELDELTEVELLMPYGGDRRDHSGSFRFRNAVLREAAYAMLTDRDRALGHQLAGEWMSRGEDADPLTQALHFQRAGDASRAMPHFAQAAQTALDANDFESAYTHAASSIACGAEGALLGAMHLVQAESKLFSGDLPSCLRYATNVVSQSEPGTATWFRAIGYATFASSVSGEEASLGEWVEMLYEIQATESDVALPQVIALLQVAVALQQRGQYHDADAIVLLAERRAVRVPQAEQPVLKGRMEGMRGQLALSEGDFDRAVGYYRASAAAYTRCGNHRRACNMRISLGFALMQLGILSESRRELEQASTRASQMGLRHVSAVADHNLGLVMALLGDIDGGLALERRAQARLAREGDVRLSGTSSAYIAKMLLWKGEPEAAESAAAAAVAEVEPFEPSKALALATLAEVLYVKGEVDRACGLAHQAWTLMETLGGVEEGEVPAALTYCRCLLALDRAPEADRVLRRAMEKLEKQAKRIANDARRHTFLNSVAVHREFLELARSRDVSFPSSPGV